MRNKENFNGRKNIYVLYDKTSKLYRQLLTANSDEELIRQYLPSIILNIPLRELVLYKVGYFYESTFECKWTTKKVVNTSCYAFPHSRLSPDGENLSLDEIEKEVNETKNKILAEKGTEDKKEAY